MAMRHFDSDSPGEFEVLGQVNGAHGALAEEINDFVGAEPMALCKRRITIGSGADGLFAANCQLLGLPDPPG